MGAGGAPQQLALGLLLVDRTAVMRRGDDPLGEVVGAGEVGPPVGDRQDAAGEERLQRRPRHAREPGAFDAVVDARRRRQVGGGQGAAPADLGDDPLDVLRLLFEKPLEAPGANAEAPPPLGEQRPDVHRHDGGLVRPLLGELAPPVDELVEAPAVVGPQPRERHQVVRRHQDVDEVDLQQPQPAHGPPQVPHVHPPPRPRPVEPLRRQRHPARLRRRQVHLRAPHRTGRV